MKTPALILLIFFTLTYHTQNASAEDRSFMHDGIERHYTIRQNATEDGHKQPAIIVLHGGGGNEKSVEKTTKFTEHALANNMIAIYPRGTGRFKRIKKLKTWNATHCCNYAMENDIDDVGFISQLIDEIIQKDNADPTRIYVTGLSNGGMMAHLAGVHLSHKIAAIAPVISGLFGDEQKPAHPVPTIIINGALDESIPISGGMSIKPRQKALDGTPFKPASYQRKFWAKANNCKASFRTIKDTYVTTIQNHCPKNAEVTHYIIHDNGHAWPGGEKRKTRKNKLSENFDATKTIMDFFTRQQKSKR